MRYPLTPAQVFQYASLISMREVDAVFPDGKLPDTVILTAERRDGYSVRRHQIHRQNHRGFRYGPTSNQGVSILIPLPLVPQVTAMIQKYERDQEAQQLSSGILRHFPSPQAPTSSPAPHSTQKPQFQTAPSSSQASSAPSQALVPFATSSLHSSPAPPSSSGASAPSQAPVPFATSSLHSYPAPPSSSRASAPSQALVPFATSSLHSSPAPPSSSLSPVGSDWSWNDPFFI